jgi:hypothetical protein
LKYPLTDHAYADPSFTLEKRFSMIHDRAKSMDGVCYKCKWNGNAGKIIAIENHHTAGYKIQSVRIEINQRKVADVINSSSDDSQTQIDDENIFAMMKATYAKDWNNIEYSKT